MTQTMLDIPLISRHSADGALLDCGACCAAMLLAARAETPTAADIAAAGEVGLTPGKSGCRLSRAALIRGAEAHGLTLFRNQGATLADLQRLLDDGQPPIVLLKYGALPDRLERRATGAHYVLLVGYDEHNGLIFVNDPHYPADEAGADGGHQRAYAQRAYAYQIFMDAWSGFDYSALVPLPAPMLTAPPGSALAFSLPTVLSDVWVVAPLGLLVRPQPGGAAPAGSPGVPFGQHLGTLSPESAPDASGHTWQNVLTDQGATGWVAASSGGNRYLAATPPAEPHTLYVLDTAPVRQAGGLSVRETRHIRAPLRERVPLGAQITVYQRVTEADGTPWLWVKAPDGAFGWARETADKVMLVGTTAPAGPASTPSFRGRLAHQSELHALPLAPARPRTPPPGASAQANLAARIWNAYGGLLEPLAAKLHIDPAVAVAVVAAESSGRSVGPDGRMIIRLENHIFWNNWGKFNPEMYNRHFEHANNQHGHTYRPTPNEPRRQSHRNQLEEWEAFGVAQKLNDRAAKLSISMGLVQIMGFNHTGIGYPTVEAMFDAFNTSLHGQLIGFFDFVNHKRLVPSLQNRNFMHFATIYNGRGQETIYGPRIQNSFEAFHTLT